MNHVAEVNNTECAFGSIAQLGEHLPYKQEVTGSSPVVPTTNLARWCSRLARQPVTLEVDGSSPFRVAKKVIRLDGFFLYENGNFICSRHPVSFF